MFTLQETFWQLSRNRARTIILLLATALLAGCMAFYLGNIRANQEAYERLAEVTKIQVNVTCGSGEMNSGLNITPQSKEKFMNSPYLENFFYDSRAVGTFSPEARSKEPEGDTFYDVNLACINGLGAIYSPDYELDFLEGYDESFFAGEDPWAVVLDDFADENGIEPGDQLTFPVYTHFFNDDDTGRYELLGNLTLTVIGLYHSEKYPVTMLVPVEWFRTECDARGVNLYYNAVGATLKDTRQINQFKQSIPDIPFLEPDPKSKDMHSGATICVYDEEYINKAEVFGQNIMMFRRFLVPFFVLAIGLIILAIFLIMRSSRQDIAIACSLGRPKFLCALSCFLAALFAEVIGCVLVFPAMVFLAGVSVSGSLGICGVFLLCSCLGNVVALAFILRFDTFTLLTAAE